jgi:hypothetical protein
MSEYAEQLARVCAWNRRLTHENATLQSEKRRLEIQVETLETINADALAERDAIDAALGAAMDAALEVKRR